MIALFASVAEDLARVETVMTRALASGEPRVASLIEELGGFHGKMLRPALLLLVARTLGPTDDRHCRLAAALELIHTATLIHDDLIDEADTRRSLPATHVRFGAPVAVLLGDYFYTRAFALVASLEVPGAVQRLTETTNIVCEGELHQMLVRQDLSISEAEYDRIIHAKTAALCALAGEYGALLGTAAQRAAAAEYGRLCGMAFQVVDDCLDFTGDPQKIGKTLATDLERGRPTLPILRALHRTAPELRGDLADRVLAAAASGDVAAVRDLIVAAGGVEDALATAREHVAAACGALEALPPGEGRERLNELATFIVARDF